RRKSSNRARAKKPRTSETCSIASRICLGKRWPALDVLDVEDPDALLAFLDDFSPTAVESHDRNVRVFFATGERRDAALAALGSVRSPTPPRYSSRAVEIDDEDWARRSQENLSPVTVGRLTIEPRASSPEPRAPGHDPRRITLVIPPSMAFGTGHHATTRLCLAALQTLDLSGKL